MLNSAKNMLFKKSILFIIKSLVIMNMIAILGWLSLAQFSPSVFTAQLSQPYYHDWTEPSQAESK